MTPSPEFERQTAAETPRGGGLAVCGGRATRPVLDEPTGVSAAGAVVPLPGLAATRLATGGDAGPVPNAQHLRRRPDTVACIAHRFGLTIGEAPA